MGVESEDWGMKDRWVEQGEQDGVDRERGCLGESQNSKEEGDGSRQGEIRDSTGIRRARARDG